MDIPRWIFEISKEFQEIAVTMEEELKLLIVNDSTNVNHARMTMNDNCGKDRWNVNQCRIKDERYAFFNNITYTKFEGLTYRMMHITRYSF